MWTPGKPSPVRTGRSPGADEVVAGQADHGPRRGDDTARARPSEQPGRRGSRRRGSCRCPPPARFPHDWNGFARHPVGDGPSVSPTAGPPAPAARSCASPRPASGPPRSTCAWATRWSSTTPCATVRSTSSPPSPANATKPCTPTSPTATPLGPCPRPATSSSPRLTPASPTRPSATPSPSLSTAQRWRPVPSRTRSTSPTPSCHPPTPRRTHRHLPPLLLRRGRRQVTAGPVRLHRPHHGLLRPRRRHGTRPLAAGLTTALGVPVTAAQRPDGQADGPVSVDLNLASASPADLLSALASVSGYSDAGFERASRRRSPRPPPRKPDSCTGSPRTSCCATSRWLLCGRATGTPCGRPACTT